MLVLLPVAGRPHTASPCSCPSFCRPFRHTQFLFMLILLPVARLPDTSSSSACSFCCQFLDFREKSQEWPQLLTSKVDKVYAGELDSGATIFCALGAGFHDTGEDRMGAARFPVHVGLPNAPVLCPLAHHIQGVLHCSYSTHIHVVCCVQNDYTHLVGCCCQCPSHVKVFDRCASLANMLTLCALASPVSGLPPLFCASPTRNTSHRCITALISKHQPWLL